MGSPRTLAAAHRATAAPVTMRTRWGCLGLIAYPVVEISLLVALAMLVGWWWVLVYLVACCVLGLGLVRYALSATGRSLSVALGALRAPDGAPALEARQASSGSPAQTVLIVPAGLLIAVPGVITTVIGLMMWIPLVRARLARRMQARVESTVYRPDGPWPPSG